MVHAEMLKVEDVPTPGVLTEIHRISLKQERSWDTSFGFLNKKVIFRASFFFFFKATRKAFQFRCIKEISYF